MSRSYKHSPVWTDGTGGRKAQKREANRRVRNYKHKIANGSAYKKLFERYDIHDWVMRIPLIEWMDMYIRWGYYEDYSEKEWKEQWAKTYRRK